jgi:WD40 repeat protein
MFWQIKQTSGNVPLASPDGRYGFLVYGRVNQEDGSDVPGVRVESWRLDRGGRSHVSRWLGGKGIVAATALPGDRIVYATDNQVVTWNAKMGKRIRAVSSPTFGPPDGCFTCVISPDGRFLAYGLANGTVHFFDIANGTTRAGLGTHSASVQRIAFSPDSRTAVTTGDDGIAIVWNPQTGEPLERLTGHSGRVLGADFSSNGKLLYTAGLDGTILQYDLGGGRRFGSPFNLSQVGTPLGPNDLQPGMPLLAVSPNGRVFATSALGGGSAQSAVELYQVDPLRRLHAITLPTGRVGAGAWADSRLVLGADGGLVQFWDVAGDKARPGAQLRGLSRKALVEDIATARDGQVVAAIGAYLGRAEPGQPPPELNEFALWHDGRLVGGKPQKLPGADVVALTADGKTAAVSVDGPPDKPVPVRIVDTSTGKVERTISVPNASGSVKALAFAPDGTLATGTWSGIVNLWNPKTGQALGHRMLVAPFPVASIAFSPDGTRFATTGGAGVSIWETATQQQLGANFPGGDGLFGNLAFTPDGRYLLSVFTDGTGYRWPVTLAAWENQACSVAHRNFTSEEWQRFVSGRSYSRVCR